MTDEQKNEFEVLKFLLDNGFKEAALFWSRNNVFLLVNLASLSAALAYFSNASGGNEPMRIGVSVFGALICVIWAFVIRAGRAMNHTWVDQAKEVASRLGVSEITTALGKTPSEGASGRTPWKLDYKSATSLMFFVATLFGLAWALIGILGPKIFS